MRQKLIILIVAILLAAVLIGLNAASYTQKEKPPESEGRPNRSTFNAGATGTQAFYSLLAETGRRVVRWQEPPAALITAQSNVPAVFVVTGTLRRDFTPPEIESLLRWVSDGGRLVYISRESVEGLILTTANWNISFDYQEIRELRTVDPTIQKEMIGSTAAVKPVQPSVFTQNVNAVQPSRFAASVNFERFAETHPPPPKAIARPDPDPAVDERDRGGDEWWSDVENEDAVQPTNDRLVKVPSPTPVDMLPASVDNVETPSQLAPMVHFADGAKNLVVDIPFGSGRIIILSDPYIVSNGGVSLVDNAQLALNLVAAGDGIIAFDEYHQGFGTDNNRFLQFFEGTPVVAIFVQMAILAGFVFFSQSRRFARPVPEPEANRLSKLEYVAAMADLQIRTKAFDLAIENIYNDFRRRAARYFGLDYFTAKSGEIAILIAERAGLDRSKTEQTLHQCEEIIRGEPTNKRQVLRLAAKLREIEQKLGMTRTGKTKLH